MAVLGSRGDIGSEALLTLYNTSKPELINEYKRKFATSPTRAENKIWCQSGPD